MQDDEREDCFYQISGQSKNLDKDDSSYSQSSKNNKSFDSAMAHLLENALVPSDEQATTDQLQQQNDENVDVDLNINQIGMRNTEFGRLQHAEEAIRQKKYMYVTYIQPDQSFRHQIKLINRNVTSSARTKQLFNSHMKPPKYLQQSSNQQMFLEQGQLMNGQDSRTSSVAGTGEIRSRQQANFVVGPSNENLEELGYNPQKNIFISSSVRASQMESSLKYQSNSVIDEQLEEEQAMTTSQFRDKRISKSKDFKSRTHQLSLDFDSLTPSNNASNRFSFVHNSEVAKIFGIVPPSSTTKKTANNLQANSPSAAITAETLLQHTFNYTRKLYLIIILNPNQFMVELKQLKMFYEPLELVSMKIKRSGGGSKTLVRKLDMNLLSERLIKAGGSQTPSYKIKTIHIPVKGQLVDVKKDGAWAQIIRNMNNFFESIEAISEFLNGREKKPLGEINFDGNLFDKNDQLNPNSTMKKKFNFPPFAKKQLSNGNSNNNSKQSFIHYYDNLLQKVLNLSEIPYSDMEMSQNLMIVSSTLLENINITDAVLESSSEEQNKLTDFEILKQKILNSKPRQKSSYESRKVECQHQQLYLTNSQNKSVIITDSEKKGVTQFNPYDRLLSSQISPQQSQQFSVQESFNFSPVSKKLKNPFVPYYLRNQNEQLLSDTKKNNDEILLQINKGEQDPQISLQLYNSIEFNEDTTKTNKQIGSPSLQHYKQALNQVFQFNPQEEIQNTHNRNSSCRNSSSQKGKLSPISRIKNQQSQFDKQLIQKIQKQSKKIQAIQLDNNLENIAIFPKSIATTTIAKFNNTQNLNDSTDDKIVYPFKSKWIKLRKNNNLPRQSLSVNNHSGNNTQTLQKVSLNFNAYERMKQSSNQDPLSSYYGGDKSIEFLKQNPISQTMNVNSNTNHNMVNQLKQSNSFQPNTQQFDLILPGEEDKNLISQIKQTYEFNHPPLMSQTFHSRQGVLSQKKQQTKRTILNQVHDSKYAENFHKQFLQKFGFNSSRQLSEILYKDAFFNYSKEELDIMFGQFLLLADHSLQFMDKSWNELIDEKEQKELVSIKQKTTYLFSKCLYIKLSFLKESFPVLKRLKELQVFRPAMKFILLNNEIVDQYFDSGKEGELQIYWKEFLRFKAFLIEQKWSRFDKITFILSIINPNNDQTLSVKQVNSIFPDNMKVSDPKQIRLMREFLTNNQFLTEGNKIPFARISDCLQKEFFLNINEIITHFLSKQ